MTTEKRINPMFLVAACRLAFPKAEIVVRDGVVYLPHGMIFDPIQFSTDATCLRHALEAKGFKFECLEHAQNLWRYEYKGMGHAGFETEAEAALQAASKIIDIPLYA